MFDHVQRARITRTCISQRMAAHDLMVCNSLQQQPCIVKLLPLRNPHAAHALALCIDDKQNMMVVSIPLVASEQAAALMESNVARLAWSSLFPETAPAVIDVSWIEQWSNRVTVLTMFDWHGARAPNGRLRVRPGGRVAP